MWQFFRDELWPVVNPGSINFEFMQEQLLAEEVWIGWDHTARVPEALKQKPDDFLAVPAPRGPEGLGFMTVVAGLGIPAGAPNRAEAEELIDYLTRPLTQIATLREVAFFPVVQEAEPTTIGGLAGLSRGVQVLADGVAKQSAAPNAVVTLLPAGLGGRAGEINKIYRDAFTRIVINREAISTVLAQEGQNLQNLLNETGAPCWPPDPPSIGPCQLELE